MSKKFGFTLAEVLITLGIIGVVAGITIPVLMNNIQDQQFKEAYKKAYSTASQAWLKAYSDNNIILCPAWTDTCHDGNFDAFKKEFKIAKDCGTNTSECWNMSGEKSWNNTMPFVNMPAFIDSSGVAWVKDSGNPEILIDINGNNPPNKYGRDRAVLMLCALSVSSYGCHANKVVVSTHLDFPNSDTSVWSSGEQQNRCPSMNTHPCYYQSWITGGH